VVACNLSSASPAVNVRLHHVPSECSSEACGPLELLRPVGERPVAHALPGGTEDARELFFASHRIEV